MTEVFLIRNQLGHYWGKAKAWVDGSDSRAVMRTKHRDQAINTLVELSSKDVELRGEVIGAELDQRGHPVTEASQIPLLVEPEPGEEASCETQEELAPESGFSAGTPARDPRSKAFNPLLKES